MTQKVKNLKTRRNRLLVTVKYLGAKKDEGIWGRVVQFKI